MKKILLFAPVILLALAGCVKDEPYTPATPDNPSTPENPSTPDTPGVATKTIFVNEVNCGTKEFEIYNASDKEADISGYCFTKDDKDPWVVPAGKGKIPAKGFLVFTAKNSDPNEGPAFGLSGTKGFKLCLYKSEDTSAENLVDMMDNSATVEGFLTVDDGWTIGRETDGADKLVLFEGGTIGKSNGASPAPAGKLCINEVNCGTKEFEIYNGTSKEADISGYCFTKDDKDPWVVPAGKGKIPAKGFLVFTAKNSDPNEGPAFGLSGTKGFKLCLYKSEDTSAENLVDMMDNSATVEGFLTVPDGTSIGRETDGADKFVLFTTPSIGESNSKGVK
ncbi:MAG: lamin tail domain-containing protein [Bacteroidales bacterium]|nr:lamin tail domain-containing protein [Bacteroidales bacterium]